MFLFVITFNIYGIYFKNGFKQKFLNYYLLLGIFIINKIFLARSSLYLLNLIKYIYIEIKLIIIEIKDL